MITLAEAIDCQKPRQGCSLKEYRTFETYLEIGWRKLLFGTLGNTGLHSCRLSSTNIKAMENLSVHSPTTGCWHNAHMNQGASTIEFRIPNANSASNGDGLSDSWFSRWQLFLLALVVS